MLLPFERCARSVSCVELFGGPSAGLAISVVFEQHCCWQMSIGSQEAGISVRLMSECSKFTHLHEVYLSRTQRPRRNFMPVRRSRKHLERGLLEVNIGWFGLSSSICALFTSSWTVSPKHLKIRGLSLSFYIFSSVVIISLSAFAPPEFPHNKFSDLSHIFSNGSFCVIY